MPHMPQLQLQLGCCVNVILILLTMIMEMSDVGENQHGTWHFMAVAVMLMLHHACA
jgi:hypothetical protein